MADLKHRRNESSTSADAASFSVELISNTSLMMSCVDVLASFVAWRTSVSVSERDCYVSDFELPPSLEFKYTHRLDQVVHLPRQLTNDLVILIEVVQVDLRTSERVASEKGPWKASWAAGQLGSERAIPTCDWNRNSFRRAPMLALRAVVDMGVVDGPSSPSPPANRTRESSGCCSLGSAPGASPRCPILSISLSLFLSFCLSASRVLASSVRRSLTKDSLKN